MLFSKSDLLFVNMSYAGGCWREEVQGRGVCIVIRGEFIKQSKLTWRVLCKTWDQDLGCHQVALAPSVLSYLGGLPCQARCFCLRATSGLDVDGPGARCPL